MTKEKLRQRFLDLSDSSGVENVEDVYNEFLNSLVLPIDSINDLSDLECYDYTLEYEYYNLWIYTNKSEYQMCFNLKKRNELEEKKEYVEKLLEILEDKEKKEKEKENQKYIDFQNKIIKLLDELKKEFGSIFSRIKSNSKFSNFEFSTKIFSYGNISFMATFKTNSFYLERYHLTSFHCCYWDFEKYDIQKIKETFDKLFDFDKKQIFDNLYKRLDFAIQLMEKECN